MICAPCSVQHHGAPPWKSTGWLSLRLSVVLDAPASIMGSEHPPCLAPALRFASSLRGCGLWVTIPDGGTRPGEEVRDDPHSDNRCGGNRCGVAPTADPRSPRPGQGSLSGAPALCRGIVRVQ